MSLQAGQLPCTLVPPGLPRRTLLKSKRANERTNERAKTTMNSFTSSDDLNGTFLIAQRVARLLHNYHSVFSYSYITFFFFLKTTISGTWYYLNCIFPSLYSSYRIDLLCISYIILTHLVYSSSLFMVSSCFEEVFYAFMLTA